MNRKYYLDTAIYIDYNENRTDRFRPLGEWALRLFSLIECTDSLLIISDILLKELKDYYSDSEIIDLLNRFKIKQLKVESTEKQMAEAKILAKMRGIPGADAHHVILARDNNAIMVTRDHHFDSLHDIVEIKKPEDLI